MTISFSGLASGLDTAAWVDALVSVKQEKVTKLQTELQDIKAKKSTLLDTRSVFTSLRSSLEKITDKKFGGTFDLFGKNTALSTNEDIFTAVAGTGALRQNYSVAVQQLATCTKAVSKNSASSIADDTTKLKNIGIKEGTLSVFVDGVKTTVNIEKDDTIGDLRADLAAAGVNAVIDEQGILTMAAQNPENEIHIGATTDTTNLVSLTGLEKKTDGSYASTNSLYKATLSSKLTAEDSGFNGQITEGTFTIGNAVFNITESTTLSSLISKINDSSEAQANAYWDDTTGKLIITSKNEGASYINIEAGTSNFTDIMGFTESSWDSEGNLVSSKMFTEAQEIGKNALFSINGTSMTSTSNTVSEDVSRITGVTLTLKKVTTEEDEPANLEVTQDTSELVEAVKNFIDSYNNLVDKVNEVTASGADFQRESSLKSFKNSLRNYAMGSNTNDGIYTALSQIGITGNKAEGASITDDNGHLVFNEETFLKAMQENPESVEAILGDENGVLGQMENTVELSLQAVTGFFDIKQSTFDSDITKMEQKITKQKDKISVYKTQMEKKFSNMELLISKMQDGYSSFLS